MLSDNFFWPCSVSGLMVVIIIKQKSLIMKKSISLLIVCVMLMMASCDKENAVQKKPDSNAKLLITVPNGDFELWDPGYWLSVWKNNSCPPCMQPVETYIVKQDSIAYSGQFAAKFIFNNAYPSWAENKFAISYHPLQLNANVKCNLVAGDTVLIKVSLFNNSQVCDSGIWLGLNSINVYSPIAVAISQSSAQADSCVIFIRGGQKSNYPNTNTEFWVDNISLQ
jgi:hypothetical protein